METKRNILLLFVFLNVVLISKAQNNLLTNERIIKNDSGSGILYEKENKTTNQQNGLSLKRNEKNITSVDENQKNDDKDMDNEVKVIEVENKRIIKQNNPN